MEKLAFGYARWSKEDSDNSSIDLQIKAIKEWCLKNGYTLVMIYEEKKSASDKDDGNILDMTVRDYINQRPVFASMLKELKPFSLLIVYRWDRLARSMWQPQVVQVLRELNVGAVSVSEGVDDLTRDIMGVISKGEVNTMKKRVKEARIDYLSKGICPFNAPFGYKKIGKRKSIEPNKKTYPILKEILRLALEGRTMMDICDEINKSGYKISLSNVGFILSNKVNCGRYYFDDKEYILDIEHPISYEEYNKIQELIKRRKLKLD